MTVAAQDTALHTIVNMTPFIPEISEIKGALDRFPCHEWPRPAPGANCAQCE